MFKILNVLESIIIINGKRKKILNLEDITKKAEKKYKKDLKNKYEIMKNGYYLLKRNTILSTENQKEIEVNKFSSFDKKIFEAQKEQLEEKIKWTNYQIEKLEKDMQYYTYELSKLLKKKINKKIGGVIQFKNSEFGVNLRLKE